VGRPRTFEDDVVVDRAMHAFWTHGYAGTSPALLADATGVAKGSLYNAFGSKRALFDRALARYDQGGAEFAADLLSRPGSTRDVIGGYLRHLVDTDLAGERRRGCLAVNTAIELAPDDPEIARALRLSQDAAIAAIAARLDRGRRDGDVSADLDAQAAAEFLLTTIAGLRVMAKIYEAPVLHRVIDSALTIL
jgi:TetR/AcrR family transcriptional repressor of nem operon